MTTLTRRDPKEISINDKPFIVYRCSATKGRKLFCNYVSSALPKIGEYEANEAAMLELLKYADVVTPDKNIPLGTANLIDNHVPNFEDLFALESEIWKHNCLFFQNGTASKYKNMILSKLKLLATEIMTPSSGQSSQAAKQHSKS